jgi:hypothetical protein
MVTNFVGVPSPPLKNDVCHQGLTPWTWRCALTPWLRLVTQAAVMRQAPPPSRAWSGASGFGIIRVPQDPLNPARFPCRSVRDGDFDEPIPFGFKRIGLFVLAVFCAALWTVLLAGLRLALHCPLNFYLLLAVAFAITILIVGVFRLFENSQSQ